MLSSIGLGYILPFLVVITVVVFFHELGHFWVARLCGVRVDAFSIGFGRALTSWTDKKGTVWKLAGSLWAAMSNFMAMSLWPVIRTRISCRN